MRANEYKAALDPRSQVARRAHPSLGGYPLAGCPSKPVGRPAWGPDGGHLPRLSPKGPMFPPKMMEINGGTDGETEAIWLLFFSL